MSNDVELYAVTPTGDKLEHRCIGVNAYESPLLFQLLCSHNPQLVPSRTFTGDEALAISGDFAEGKQKVLAFLERCVELNNQHHLVDAAELEGMIQKVTAVLNQPKLEGCTHALLESMDVAQMVSANPQRQLQRDCTQIIHAAASLEERLNRIFVEAPNHPKDEKDEEEHFFNPDDVTDEEYAAYTEDDIKDAELASTPQENLNRLGFGEFGDYYNFTR